MNDTKWCPECGAEYVPGVTTCADCGVALADAPPAPPVVPVEPDDELEPVEFDLTEWPEQLRADVEWRLRGVRIAFEWIEDGVLAVPGERADEVEAFLDDLAAGPPKEIELASDEWRTTVAAGATGVADLSIDDFYEGDPAREDSEEEMFGDEWHDADGVQCEVDWVHDTGELYLMKAPKWMPFMVEILDVVPTLAEVEQLLHGWEAAMPLPNSAQWVRDRVAAQAATASAASELPSEDPAGG